MSRFPLVPTHGQILTSPSSPLYSTCLHSDLLPPPSTTKVRSETTYPVQKEDKVPEGAVNLETVET